MYVCMYACMYILGYNHRNWAYMYIRLTCIDWFTFYFKNSNIQDVYICMYIIQATYICTTPSHLNDFPAHSLVNGVPYVRRLEYLSLVIYRICHVGGPK
jgi:hypothetical protein